METIFKCIFLSVFTLWLNDLKAQSGIQQEINGVKSKTSPLKISPFSNNLNSSRIANNEKKVFKASARPIYLSLNTTLLKKIIAQKPQLLELIIPTDGNNRLVLELIPVNIFAKDFKVTTGNNIEVPYVKGTFYHGIIKGSKKSLVAINVFDNEISGIICDESGNKNIEIIKSGSNDYVMYLDNSLNKKTEFQCGSIDMPLIKGGSVGELNKTAGVGCKVVNIFIEADYALYQNHSSSITATSDFVMTLFNEVASLYRNENITIQMSSLRVWSNPDPYSSSNTAAGTLDLIDNTLQQNFVGDISHLISGKNFGGGKSNIDVLCNKAIAHGVSADNGGSYYPQSYSNFAAVVAHEVGHSLGSRHTHACVWNGNNTAIDNCGPIAGYTYEGNCSGAPTPTNGGTIMSYCQLVNGIGVNFANGFGTLPGNLIRSKVSNASCLSTDCSSCTDQFESNNSVSTATNVFANPLNSNSSNYTLQGNIGFVDDFDWYRVNIGTCGKLTVNLSNLPYNYNLELWNSTGTAAIQGSYLTGTSNESVSFDYRGSSTAYIKVYSQTPTNYITSSCYNLQFIWAPCSGCTPPSNDLCSSGVPTLPVGATCTNTQGDMSCATQSYAASGCPSGLIQDVWYKFTANSTGTYTITLAPSSGMDGVVEVREGSCTGNVLGCKDAGGGNGAIETLDVSVSNGTVYYVRVYEYNLPGNTTPPATTSFNICVTGSSCTTPSSPSNNAPTNITATSFQANWSTVSGATAYYVDVATDAVFLNMIYNNVIGNNGSLTINALSCNTTYYYRVRASNSCGSSGNSSTNSVPTSACCTTPSSPSNNAPTNITATSFQANWSTVSGAIAYYVDVATDGAFSNMVYNNVIGNNGFLSIISLSCNTIYYYRIRASNSCGLSGNSSINSVPTSACCTTPSSPSNNAPTNITATSLQANWSNVSGATVYYVDVATDALFINMVYNNIVGNDGFLVINGLSCNTIYYYRVRAANSCGLSGNSSTNSVPTSVCCTVSNWLGTSDNSWHNPLNWSCGIVPDGSIDVIIASGTPYNCIVYQDAACRSLTLSKNTIFTVQPGKKLNIINH